MVTEADVKACAALLPQAGFLHIYLAWGQRCTDAPLAYHLAGGLGLLAVTSPLDLGMEFAGSILRSNLFAVVAGRSGEDRKSHTLKLANDLLAEVAPGLVGTEPATSAGLIDSLSAAPAQLISYSELGGFLADASTGNGHKETLKAEYNKAYDCVGIERVKANQNRISVPNPRLSILAACATPYLERYTDATDWTGGFMSRWFLLLAHRERNYTLGGKSDPVLRALLVQALNGRAFQPVTGVCKGLDPAAEDRWNVWQPEIMARAMPERIRGARVRAPTLALKIAVLLASDRNPAIFAGFDWWVELADLEPAIQIAELHLKSAMALADTLVDGRDMRDRRSVLGALHDAGTALTFGQIIRASKLLKRRTHEIIDTLLEEGAIVAVNVSGTVAYAVVRP